MVHSTEIAMTVSLRLANPVSQPSSQEWCQASQQHVYAVALVRATVLDCYVAALPHRSPILPTQHGLEICLKGQPDGEPAS